MQSTLCICLGFGLCPCFRVTLRSETGFDLRASNKVWGHAKTDSKEICTMISATSRCTITWRLSLYPNSTDATDFVAPVKSKVLEDTDLGTVQHREDGDWADRRREQGLFWEEDSNRFHNQEGWCRTAIPKLLEKTWQTPLTLASNYSFLQISPYRHRDVTAEDYRRVQLHFQRQNTTISLTNVSQYFKI